jgi:PDZ domain
MAARLPIFVCALALSLAGCASSGTELKDSQLTQFQKGVTTESDVLRALGAPTATSSNSDGSAVLVYAGAHAQAKAASFIPIVGLFAGGSTAEATSVAFRFGPDHRLIDYQVTHGTTDVSLGGARTDSATRTTNVAPADSAPPSAPQAETLAAAARVRLGVHCMQVTPELAQTDHLPAGTGVRVVTVEAGSAAEAFGIKVGDVIRKYGDRSVSEISDLSAAIAATTPGAEVPITVWRRTGEQVVDIQF